MTRFDAKWASGVQKQRSWASGGTKTTNDGAISQEAATGSDDPGGNSSYLPI